MSKSKNPNDAIETARAIGELVQSIEFKENTRYFSFQDILNKRAELHAAHARRETAAVKQTASTASSDTKSAQPKSRKKWTPEKLAELKAYRETHTMPETAKRFGIAEQRIRKLLPRARPKASPFPTVIHRVR